MLVDPDALGKQLGVTGHMEISGFVPSADGALVAVSTVVGGAERATEVRIVDVASGKLLPDVLVRAWQGVSGFTNDDKALYYNQLPEVAPGHEAEAELNSLSLRHMIGSTAPDVPVFGINIDPKVPFVPTDSPIVAVSPVTPWALGLNVHGVLNELTMYVAPARSLDAGGPIPWRKVIDVPDDVTGFDIAGDTLYLLSHKGASHYQVTRLDLSKPDATAADARVIVPADAGVIQGVNVAKDGLYVRGTSAGLATLRKLAFNADGSLGAVGSAALPFPGTLADFATDARVNGATFGFASWTKPELIYHLGPTGALADTGIRKPPSVDVSSYESSEIQVPSTDGVMVPVSVIMKKGTKLDGTAPTYIEAYGAYGLNLDPYFLGSSFAWIDAGGIFVIAHVRGGGENGEDWHLAGQKATKQHTIDDAIATARYLIAHKYTAATHLAIEGTSAGGIMINGAVTQHPDLFAGALDVVGMADTLRSETEPNGPGNIAEFGTTATAGGASALYNMDGYQHVKRGTQYPAVMGVTGINDPRVAPWQVAKMTARLARATTSGRPILLYVDYDAGHGLLGASAAQTIRIRTDEYSFLLWQCGSPLFAGVPTHIWTKHA